MNTEPEETTVGASNSSDLLGGNMNAVQMTAQMYEARAALRAILGEEKFRKKVAEHAEVMDLIMQKRKCSDMEAMLEIMKHCQKDGMQLTLAIGCCTEVIEPSLPPNMIYTPNLADKIPDDV